MVRTRLVKVRYEVVSIVNMLPAHQQLSSEGTPCSVWNVYITASSSLCRTCIQRMDCQETNNM